MKYKIYLTLVEEVEHVSTDTMKSLIFQTAAASVAMTMFELVRDRIKEALYMKKVEDI